MKSKLILGKAHGFSFGFTFGFTLIEVMIVLVIITILAAVAYPSYRQYVTASERSVAKSTLLDVSARQNQYFSNNKTFASVLADLGLPTSYYVDGSGQTTAGDALYQITLANVTTTTFEVSATPQNRLALDDTLCGRYTLDERGAKTFSGGGSVDDCW